MRETRLSSEAVITPDAVKTKIVGAFRESFEDPGAAQNRAEFVAEKLGTTTGVLYRLIRELGLKATIDSMRASAQAEGLVIRPVGMAYTCSVCGSKEHNARSCPKKKRARTRTA